MTRADLQTAELRFVTSHAGGDWSIRAHETNHLVAQGPGHSRDYGIELFGDLANGREIDKSNALDWAVDAS